MAEQQFIPTITVIEGIPPLIDIITFYEALLGVPNILEGFIAAIDGKESNGVLFTYGQLGVVMKNWPELIDVTLHEGEFSVITPKLTDDDPGDAENYFIDADGNLGYFFEDIPFSPIDLTEFEWGLDFGDSSTLTLTGSLIDSIDHITGSPQAGNWAATGIKRPTLVDGAAVFDGSDDELLASFLDNTSDGELFIVGKIIQDNNYFLSQGDATADGNNISFGTKNGKVTLRETIGTAVNYDGTLVIDQGSYQLFHYKKNVKHRYNGFLDESGTVTRWFSDNFGTANGLVLGKIKQTTEVYYPIAVKEILSFNSLDDEKRKCIEVYLKYKHDLPVYVNPHQFL